MNIVKPFVLAAACISTLASFSFALPAFAKQRPIVVTAPKGEDLPTRRVSYRDLNLATWDGEKTLRGRFNVAAREVCLDGGHELFDAEFDGCQSFALRGARPQIARAVQRAREIAANGHSSIPLVAIALNVR